MAWNEALNLRGPAPLYKLVDGLWGSAQIARLEQSGPTAAMESVAFGRATDRRVLGSMNELAFQASLQLAQGDDLLTISRGLADTLMSAIGAACAQCGGGHQQS